MTPPWEKGTCDMDSICITLKAVHNQLAAQERWPGVSGQVKSYSVVFELATPDWDGLSVTAVFADGAVSKDVLGITAGEAVPVPHECMATAGRTVSVALYGTDSSGVVLNTNYARLFRTGAGADPAGDTSADPTLPVWAQIQGQIGDLDELDTEDKSSLVAAINEAAQSGGGTGGTTDHTKLKNRDAADQHPIGAITGLETALAEKYSAENPPPSGTSLGITSATVGQIAKITAVDASGAPTAWSPVDMPTGGGEDEWVKVAEATLTEIVNEIRLNFGPCKAAYIELQYGAVENDLGVIGIYPNPQMPIYTGENRAAAITQTTSDNNKRGYIFCTIDRRKGTQWVATSQTFYRADGTFGSIEPGAQMNCEIGCFNNNTWASIVSPMKLVGTDYVSSVSAFGAGMNIGTTLKVWGIKA